MFGSSVPRLSSFLVLFFACILVVQASPNQNSGRAIKRTPRTTARARTTTTLSPQASQDDDNQTTEISTWDEEGNDEQRMNDILDKTNATIQFTSLQLYKRKTQLSLNLLNKVVPLLQSIRQNMSDLVKSTENPDSPLTPESFASFKHSDDILENRLTEVENQMDENHRLLNVYTTAYRRAEENLKTVHDTLAHILSRGLDSSSSYSIGRRQSASVSTVCGGNLTTLNGSIIYKKMHTLNEMEGCLWVIKAGDLQLNSRWTMTLNSAGFQTTYGTYLSVGYFTNAEYDQPTNLYWRKFSQFSSTPQSIVVDGPVVFVHFVTAPTSSNRGFSSNSNMNTGFELNFAAVAMSMYTSNNGVHFNFNNFLLPAGSSGSFRYPQNGSQYSNNERVAFILQPSQPNTELFVKWINTELRVDSLNIFSYNALDYCWTRQLYLHGNYNYMPTSSPYYTSYTAQGLRSDPILLTFKSDGSQTYAGFEIFWRNT